MDRLIHTKEGKLVSLNPWQPGAKVMATQAWESISAGMTGRYVRDNTADSSLKVIDFGPEYLDIHMPIDRLRFI